jgi:hypothetical protein
LDKEWEERGERDTMEMVGRASRSKVPREMTIRGDVLEADRTGMVTSIDWLIDTGAEKSFISMDIFLKKLKGRVMMMPTTVKMSAINGSHVEIMGRCSLIVEFEGKQITHEYIVADIEDKGVLGMDFLQEYRCSWDWDEEKLHPSQAHLCIKW